MMKRKRVIALGVVLGVPISICTCVVLYVTLWSAGLIDVNACPPASLKRMARFELPPSAHLLDSDCAGFRGWTANARFEMRPDDLDTFMNSTEITAELTNTGTPDRDWCPYNLDETTPHLYAVYDGYHEMTMDGTRYVEFEQWVYIDTSNPELYVVYICALGG